MAASENAYPSTVSEAGSEVPHIATVDAYEDETGKVTERPAVQGLGFKALGGGERSLHIPERSERLIQLDRSGETDTRDT